MQQNNEVNNELEAQELNNLKGHGILIAVVSLLIFAVVLWLTIFQRELLLRFSTLGYFGLLITNFLGSATVFFPLPATLSSILGGNTLNPYFVGFFAGLGSALGDLLGFILGYGARNVANKVFHKDQFLGRFEPWIRKNALLAVFLFAFFPNPFFDGVGLLAGALNLKMRDFFLATLAGRVLRNTLLALTGQKFLD